MSKWTPEKPFPRELLAVFVFLTLLLLAGGFWFYRSQERLARQDAEADLETIAQLKVDQIASWRAERLADAAIIAASPLFIEGAARWIGDPQPGDVEYLQIRLRALYEYYEYQDVLLVDTVGAVHLSISGQSGPLHSEAIQALDTALRSRQPMLSDLHFNAEGSAHIDVIAPLFAGVEGTGEPVGAVILQCDAEQFLYPLIQFWPVRSQSAETLLVRQDGDEVLFLNDLRDQSGAALTLRIPLSETDVPAVMAVLGAEGLVEGQDYRGVEVLSVIHPIPDSPWFLVAKIDTAEALSAWLVRSTLILALIALGVLSLAGLAGLVWQINQKAHYQALAETKHALNESEGRYHKTLMSVSDGVIATDTDGRIQMMNPVAEALTGWNQAEAVGKPLEEVFHIVSEETHEAVESTVSRILREGSVIGLANHTLLLARDGAAHPISDGGAPIRDMNGRIVGVVVNFRDQTEERRVQAALCRSEEQYRLLAETTRDIIILHDMEGCIRYMNRAGLQLAGIGAEDMLNKPVTAFVSPAHLQGIADRRETRVGGDRATFLYETEVIGPSGQRVSLEASSALMEHEDETLILIAARDITERKLAEEALKESELRYHSLFDRMPVGLYRTAPDGRILDANPALVALLGFPDRETLLRARTHDFYVDLQDRATHRNQVKQDSRVIDYETRLRRYDGSVIWIVDSMRVVRDEAGEDLYYEGSIRDITGLKEAEEALVHERDLLHALMDNIPDFVYYKDTSSRFTRINQAHARLLGLSGPADAIGKTDHDLFPPELAREVLADEQKILRSGEPLVGKIEEIKRPDGSQLWVLTTKVLLRDADGQATGLVGISRDITGLKLAEEKLRLQALALDSAANGIVITNRNGIIEWVNPAFASMTGYTAEEIVGQSPRIIKSDQQDRIFYEHLWQTILAGKNWHGELVNRRKDGSLYTEELTIAPLVNADGEISHFVGINQDITERKQIEKRVRRLLDQQTKINELALALGDESDLNQLYNTLFRQISGLMDSTIFITASYNEAEQLIRAGYVMTPDGPLDVNGFPPIPLEPEGQGTQSQVIRTGKPLYVPDLEKALKKVAARYTVDDKGQVSEGPPPEDAEDVARSALYAPMKVGGRVVGVMQVQSYRPDAYTQDDLDLFAGLANVAAIAIQNARLYQELESYSEFLEQAVEERTAELEEANERLQELDRMKDTFLSTAAHELRTPLTTIRAFSELLLIREFDDGREKRYLTMIMDQSERLADIINDLLDVSKLEATGGLDFSFEPIVMGDLARETLQSFIDTSPRHTFTLEGLDGLPPVRGDRFRLGQVLSNLLSNAVKYSPDGGAVTLRGRVLGGKVEISIQDEGMGVTPEQQVHLFDKFYRAPGASGIAGTGLGLAICKLIVEKHGGRIRVESEYGKGSTFFFSLPLYRVASAAG
jgi:PAS domain S-box-containing protein